MGHGRLKRLKWRLNQQTLKFGRFNRLLLYKLEVKFKKVFKIGDNERYRVNNTYIDETYGDQNVETVLCREIAPLSEGDSYTFQGVTLPNCETFSINFMTSTEIALHINPRIPQNYIVRNARIRNHWGQAENSSALPFCLRRDSKFKIQVLVTDGSYRIAVNGNHYAKFNHRLHPNIVNRVEVNGHLGVITMSYERITYYPKRTNNTIIQEIQVSGGGQSIPYLWRLIRSHVLPGYELHDSSQGLQLPYYGHVPANTFKEGHCVRIEGRVKLLPHSFFINLQKGDSIWPHPVIAFHFCPYFSKESGALGKAMVARSVWQNGKWAYEERSGLDANLCPGRLFDIAIVCDDQAYLVYINKQLIITYQHHMDALIVDTVYIQGDIKLWSVMIERFNEQDKRIIVANNLASVRSESLPSVKSVSSKAHEDTHTDEKGTSTTSISEYMFRLWDSDDHIGENVIGKNIYNRISFKAEELSNRRIDENTPNDQTNTPYRKKIELLNSIDNTDERKLGEQVNDLNKISAVDSIYSIDTIGPYTEDNVDSKYTIRRLSGNDSSDDSFKDAEPC